MGLDSIFALFGFSEGDNKDLKKMKDDLEVYKETPPFRVGMFVKIIMNGNVFKKQIIDGNYPKYILENINKFKNWII